ncbi:MAG: glycosyltransferase family 2 protein [Actinomycetota bacterium]
MGPWTSADGRDSVAVVIPALDEAGNIAHVVGDILGEGVSTVVVVDNGSSDDTAAVAAAAGAIVVDEPMRGYGQACATGSAEAIRRGADIVVYIDGDRSSRADELDRLLEPMASGADLVLGSRVLGTIDAGAMGVHQRFGNWLTAAIMRFLYAIEVTDLGPYRAIRAELLERLEMREMTFGWPTEMTVKAARHGATIVEVPVTWQQRGSGQSKVSGTIKGTILAGWYLLSVTIKHARPIRRSRRKG